MRSTEPQKPRWRSAYSVILCMTFMTSSTFLAAQLPNDCQLSPEMEAELENLVEPLDPCLDKEEIIQNCTPVYIRINVHFILDDNCEGAMAAVPDLPEDMHPSNAFYLAEKLISDANAFYETVNSLQTSQWNQVPHGVPETPHQCVPFRYILTGVYLHCRTSAQFLQSLSFSAFSGLYVNNSSEVNVFMSNIGTIGGTNTSGFASQGTKRVAVENNGLGLFNHELGHVFSLVHTFVADDGCDDTWPHVWAWDGGKCEQDVWINQCDGIAELSSLRGCWGTGVDHLYTRKHPLTECLFAGANSCDLQMFCTEHPCCFWENQNNNVMCYSKWAINPAYAVLTPCQVDRGLTHISGELCPYIEQIGGDCPPPYANLGTVPNVS